MNTPTHPTLPPEELEYLAELMTRCAQAMYDDGELNANGCGVNPFEAASALNEVAGILGIPGPTEIVDDMYEQGDGS